MKTFDTISLHLAASILTEVDGSSFKEIDHINTIDGKSKIVLSYPEEQEEDFQRVINAYRDKSLMSNIYLFNRNLNYLRDQLFLGRGARRNG